MEMAGSFFRSSSGVDRPAEDYQSGKLIIEMQGLNIADKYLPDSSPTN